MNYAGPRAPNSPRGARGMEEKEAGKPQELDDLRGVHASPRAAEGR
jgi:hypothetical protein